MEFVDLVKDLGYKISFEAISEPRTDGVALRFIVNRSKDVTDLIIYPHPDSKVTTLQIDFQNYITYSVVYDDYTVWNDENIFQGDSFRIYERSSFLQYVKKELGLLNKNLKHYSLVCFEHQVDIISEYEPKVSEIIL
ncbi:hypothetical protein D8M04_04285 [Oceanobacillus piezotolerans]|uniref:Uncharacterized protein n=1 Tax=Oceanobacillus piezotolerans TaxID=2448030 RepID=A0A498DAV4_9BACI|nr:hypothetical protein [Oceanobacillus piezotolerans]RLL48483.1 hypothetical protein D8M04_04285 [Oceanobacillus piezotolerans]